MEEVQERLVTTLVLGLDFRILQVTAMEIYQQPIRGPVDDPYSPSSHPSVDLIRECLNMVFNLQLALESFNRFRVLVFRGKHTNWYGDALCVIRIDHSWVCGCHSRERGSGLRSERHNLNRSRLVVIPLPAFHWRGYFAAPAKS